MDGAAIVDSLERAGQLCEDLTPRVYARLFAEHPELAAMFRQEAHDNVKGEMLARALEAILDCATDDVYGANLVEGEAANHEGYCVSREVFVRFFAAIAGSLRDLLGAQWTPAMEQAWEELARRFERLAQVAPQAAPQASPAA